MFVCFAGLMLSDWLCFLFPSLFLTAMASPRRTSSVEPDQSLEVVGKVCHADLGGGLGNADGADR